MDILILKVKIWIDAHFSGQWGDLWEYVYTIPVFSSFIRLMNNQERVIADQKSEMRRSSEEIGPSTYGIQEKAGVLI